MRSLIFLLLSPPALSLFGSKKRRSDEERDAAMQRRLDDLDLNVNQAMKGTGQIDQAMRDPDAMAQAATMLNNPTFKAQMRALQDTPHFQQVQKLQERAKNGDQIAAVQLQQLLPSLLEQIGEAAEATGAQQDANGVRAPTKQEVDEYYQQVKGQFTPDQSA